jgi:hypothetical protein
MTVDSLKKLIAKQEELGLDTCVLQMQAPKSWRRGRRYSERVKTPFGLCRWNGGYHEDSIVIYPSLSQLKAYVEKYENLTIWAIIIDQEKLTAGVYEMKMRDKAIFDGHPTQKILREFFNEAEAYKCLLHATAGVRNDPEPSEGSSP